MRIWPLPLRLLLPVLAVAAAATWLLLRTPAPDPLRAYAPEFDPVLAELLRDDDDQALFAYCRELGYSGLGKEWSQVLRPALDGIPGAFAELEFYLVRLGAVFEEVYATRFGVQMVDMLRATPPVVMAAARRREAARNVLRTDTALDDSARVAEVRADREFYVDHDLTWFAIGTDTRLVRLETGRGRRAAAWRHLQRALADARRIDDHSYVCQLLGMACQMHLEEGRPDSARHALDLAEARARRSRAPAQTARILGFRAALARDEGRFGAAHLHLLEAWRVCEEYRGGGMAVRTLLDLADLYEDLECRSAEARVLATLRTTITLPPRVHDLVARSYEDLRLLKLDMRFAFASGDTTRALAAMDSLAGVFGPRPYTEVYTRMLHDQAEILAEAGRTDKAADVAGRALAHARADSLPSWEATLLILRADLALAQGDRALARTALAAWRELDRAGVTPVEPDTRARAVDLGIRLADDESERVAALRAGLASYREAAARGDADIGSYLRIEAYDPLRWRIHALLADDPALGLDFDMRWRQLGRPGSPNRCPGCGEDAGCVCPAATSREILVAWARPAGETPFSDRLQAAAARDSLGHVLYVAGPEAVWRWWTDAAGTRREVLAAAPATLTARTAELAAALGDPRNGGDPDPGLVAELRSLGRLLLPLEQPRPARRLLVTADGALARIPFAALDLRTDGPYHPLQQDVLVAHLRRATLGRPAVRLSPALVVVGDAPPPDLVRRRPDLVRLPGATREGASVAQAWPGSRLLDGEHATKSAVLAGLRRASRLHVAGHVVQDAETPYLSFLPLARGSAGSPLEDALLEPRDVLGVPLAGCELVVLSGCSSGLTFVAGTRQAPSFGAVFLDAGVTHAVQAGWDVDDDMTAEVMAEFARHTAGTGDVWAYAGALRAATAPLRDGITGARHPFAWAPWSVTTTDPGF